MLPQDWSQLVVAWKQLEAAGRGRAEEGASYAPGSAGGEGSHQKSPTVYPVGSLKRQHFWKNEKETPSTGYLNGVLVVVLDKTIVSIGIDCETGEIVRLLKLLKYCGLKFWTERSKSLISSKISTPYILASTHSFLTLNQSKPIKKGVSMYFCTLVPSSDVHNSWAPLEWFWADSMTSKVLLVTSRDEKMKRTNDTTRCRWCRLKKKEIARFWLDHAMCELQRGWRASQDRGRTSSDSSHAWPGGTRQQILRTSGKPSLNRMSKKIVSVRRYFNSI